MRLRPATHINLADFADDRRYYSLETNTLEYERVEDPGDRILARGYGCEILTIARGRRRGFAALYSDGSRLLLFLLDQLHDMSAPEVKLHLGIPLAVVRRVRVSVRGEVVQCIWQSLSRLESREWPEGDFLRYVERKTRDLRDILGTMYAWDAMAAGRRIDSEEFQVEMSKFVEAHCK